MIIILLLGFFLLFKLTLRYYDRNWYRNLRVDLSYDMSSVHVGQQIVIKERIENRKKMPLPIIEVGFQNDRSMMFADMANAVKSDYMYKRDVFSMSGRQRITRKIQATCERRGFYEINEVDLVSYILLSGDKYLAKQPVYTSIYVYPKLVDVKEIKLLCERMMGDVSCQKNLYEDPFSFSSIREYTTTDPMKNINYKASARMGQWMVNTFDSTHQGVVNLFVDLEEPIMLKEPKLLEETISIADSLVLSLMRAGMDVSVWANTEETFDFSMADVLANKSELEKRFALIDTGQKMIPFSIKDEEKNIHPQPILEQKLKEAEGLCCIISKNLEANRDAIAMLAKETPILWIQPVEMKKGREVVKAAGLTHYLWELT